MVTPIILPQLGDTMDEGTITRWFKREGEAVAKGEPLFEVLTDKANIEVEATASGYLRQVLAEENATVPTGRVIAYLATTLEEPLGVEQVPATAEPPTQDQMESSATLPVTARPEGAGGARKRRFVSPRARRIAAQYGVDIGVLTPSSRTGRIMEADVRRFMAEQATLQAPAPARNKPTLPPVMTAKPVPGGASVTPIAGIRKVIFDRMSASARETARVTLTTEADATRLVELRQDINSHQSENKYSFTDLLALLVARALLKYPYMNATLQEDGIHQHAAVHLGLAVDTERGLIVPVLRDADRRGLAEIYMEARRLGEAARGGQIAPDDLRGGTFTVTNLGQYDVDAFTPIINRPETSILGIGRIAQKAAAFEGALALRWMVTLSLAFDHRVIDGAPAARFLQQVKRYVETPGLVLI